MQERKARGKLLKILWERRLYKPGGRLVPPTGSEILMAMVCIIMATLVLTWSSGIEPPGLPEQTTVNLVRLDRYNVACTIHTISPPDAHLNFLTYTNATGGTYILNQMANKTEPVNAVGEPGIIYVRGYNEHVKVVAVFSDAEHGKNQTVFDRVI